MMDGRRIRRDAGGAAGDLINPPAKAKAKDFGRANVQAMREKERVRKQCVMDAQIGQKAPFKMKQFEGVGAKVKVEAERVQPVQAKQGAFMHRGEGKMAQPILPAEPVSPRRVQEPARPKVPRAAEAQAAPVREVSKNHILVNKLIAEEVGLERRDLQKPKDPVEHRLRNNFGKVPTYLAGIKQSLADDKQRQDDLARKEDVPPGYRMMPEDERQETLGSLREKLHDMEEKHRKLPLKIESERAKRMEKEIETKISELEAAIKLFSRQKVLIEL